MTRGEVAEAIHGAIQSAVQKSGGNWRRGYRREVEYIFEVMGKLSPEPKSKPTVPQYDLQLVVRAGEKFKFSDEDRRVVQELMKGFNLEM